MSIPTPISDLILIVIACITMIIVNTIAASLIFEIKLNIVGIITGMFINTYMFLIILCHYNLFNYLFNLTFNVCCV